MPFRPRSVTGIPTEPVGSLPRPQALLDAYRAFDAGRIGSDELEAAQDDAVHDTVVHCEATGAPIISDGEQRRWSFAAYPIVGASGVAERDPHDGPVLLDGHGRRLPRLSGGPFRYGTYSGDTLPSAMRHTGVPMKQSVVSPSTLAQLYPLHAQMPDYQAEQFERDLVDECERDIRSAFTAGAARVSLDYSDGQLTDGEDPRHTSGGGVLPSHGIDLIAQVLQRFSARERMDIGVHVCAPPDHDRPETAYLELIPEVLRLDAGYFLLQLAEESDRDAVCAAIGAHLRSDANGVTPTAFVGVIDTRSPRVESATDVADILVRAAAHIPPEQLGSTDDCGFSPFSHDPKPLAGLLELARGIAFRKIRSRVEGTLLAAEKLGFA